jgi:hypothetical protein
MLLARELTIGRSFRLLGVGVSGFTEISQLELPLVWDTGIDAESEGGIAPRDG